MTDGSRKVPSKTFHFVPDFEDDLVDLFQHHLMLTYLLEASTGIVAIDADVQGLARAAIADADVTWIRFLRGRKLPPN